jgi:AAA15 family ATPase/GTPase
VDDKIKLLKTNAIYGANASGKSNFISSMYFFKDYIFSQFLSKKENFDSEDSEHARIKLEPFLLSETTDDASEFEVIFFVNGKYIQYGFECTLNEVLNEWYYINDKKIFERNGTKASYGSKYQKVLNRYNKIPSERLYLSVLEYFLEDEAKKEILGDFLNFFTSKYNIYFELLLESSINGIAGVYRFSKKLINDQMFRNNVVKYLKLIDVGIKNIDIQEEIVVNKKTRKESTKKIIKTVHDVYDETGKVIGEKYFDLMQESAGTLRFFAYIQDMLTMLEQGGVFVIDELSARFHPKLTKLIIDIFQSEMNKKAQLIFTTHDISLLNNNQFRRDEVIFIEKSERGESKLFALSDLKVREDSTFNKDYMQGKYGAIPKFNYDELLGGEM